MYRPTATQALRQNNGTVGNRTPIQTVFAREFAVRVLRSRTNLGSWTTPLGWVGARWPESRREGVIRKCSADYSTATAFLIAAVIRTVCVNSPRILNARVERDGRVHPACVPCTKRVANGLIKEQDNWANHELILRRGASLSSHRRTTKGRLSMGLDTPSFWHCLTFFIT